MLAVTLSTVQAEIPPKFPLFLSTPENHRAKAVNSLISVRSYVSTTLL